MSRLRSEHFGRRLTRDCSFSERRLGEEADHRLRRGSWPFATVSRWMVAGNLTPRSGHVLAACPLTAATRYITSGGASSTLNAPTMKKVKSAALRTARGRSRAWPRVELRDDRASSASTCSGRCCSPRRPSPKSRPGLGAILVRRLELLADERVRQVIPRLREVHMQGCSRPRFAGARRHAVRGSNEQRPRRPRQRFWRSTALWPPRRNPA